MLTDMELELAYEAGAEMCPQYQNDEHIYGLRAVQQAVSETLKITMKGKTK